MASPNWMVSTSSLPQTRVRKGSAPGVIDPRLDWSTSAQVSCFPTEHGGWGLFARLYRGQDYYNVGFLDHITRLHIGATFNQTGFFRFAKPPKETP